MSGRPKNLKRLFYVVLVLFVVLIGFSIYYVTRRSGVRVDTFAAQDHGVLSERQEIKMVDSWIEHENLNTYGDPKGTVYALGNPLVNKAGEEVKTLLEYIREQHLSEPWKEQ